MRWFWKKIATEAADDTGVAGLAIAAVIMIVSSTALSVLLGGNSVSRDLRRAQASAANSGNAVAALIVQVNQSATVPCPDRNEDGDTEATCDGSGGFSRAGTLPWRTLGIQQSDAVDAYGNYYTYVVSDVAKDICLSIANDYDSGAAAEVTGSLIDATDLEVLLTTESIGTGTATPFVVLSHGPNGFGAISENGTQRAVPPTAHSFEANNDLLNPTAIYTGPLDENGTNAFDDQVFVATSAELQAVCERLTPGGALNASVTENFESGAAGIDSTKFATGGTAPTKTTDSTGNGVASFADDTSYLATAAAFDFTPTVRPVYVAALWTPNPALGETTSGFSIATRATAADLGANSDIFDQNTDLGLTFRFDDRDGSTSSNGGVANNITIRDDTGQLAISAGTYSLINGETYLIEVYDNGDDVWMRITQSDDVTNTAFASTTNITVDLTGDQRVLFINSAVQSFIDEITVGIPMLALETDGAAGYAATAAAANGTTTGDLTLEAWFRPLSLPTGTNRAAIISQWDTSGTDAEQSFRLYLDSDNNDHLTFDIGGTISSVDDTESFELGLTPAVNEWTHVAVTFDSTSKAVLFYLNGTQVRSALSTTDSSTGVRAAVERFSVGTSFAAGSTAGDFFHGNLSDVRVWDDVRTRAEILDCFQTRLPSTACPTTNLVVNWKLDPAPANEGLAETDALASPAGTAGTLTSATYVPALAVNFRPFSTSFCPSGTRVGTYQCDFRDSTAAGLATSVTIPAALNTVHVKAWGAGGGGYDVASDEREGGAAGFSRGLIESINSVAIAGQSINIFYGGHGTGSTTADQGAGAGAGSGVYNSTNTVAGLVAGGGGGGSFSDHNVSGGGNCSTAIGGSACGVGGHGGGIGASTTRAPAEGSLCGGRGGDNTPSGNDPPSVAGDCDDGGTDPTGTFGGAGTTGPLGGGAALAVLRGGRGIDADEADGDGMTNAPGGGGGGGGATGGEAGGYDDNNNSRGYGGGGGSGTADGGVSIHLERPAPADFSMTRLMVI